MSATRPVPREDPQRCAVQAQERDDPMIGTAPPAARLLLVEQPGPWGRRTLLDSHADPAVAERIATRASAAGLRIQVVRRPGRHADAPPGSHRVALVDTRRDRRTTRWWIVPDLRELADALIGVERDDDGFVPPEAEVDAAPVLLVCTHGGRDACCALRGRPVAAAFAALRPDRVWETTHVGGDRFAANLLVLPTGELYGRVTAVGASDLLGRIEAGRVDPALLRGRLGLPPLAQAGLVVAHERLGIDALNDLEVLGVDQPDDDTARVRVRSPAGEHDVDLALAWSDRHRLTCRGPAQARARAYRGVSVGPPQ